MKRILNEIRVSKPLFFIICLELCFVLIQSLYFLNYQFIENVGNSIGSFEDNIVFKNEVFLSHRGVYCIDAQYQNNSKKEIAGYISAKAADASLTGVTLSDEIPMFNYQKTVSFRIYQLKNRNDISILVENQNTDNPLKVSQVTITYLPVESCTRQIVLSFAWLGLLDLFLALFVLKKWENIPKQKKINIITVIITTFIATLPLTTWYITRGHDLQFHLQRIFGIAEGLRSHQFPVKIQPRWSNNYGYAVGVCYGDIMLYFPAILHLLGISLSGSYKCYIVVSTMLNAIISMKVFSIISGSEKIGCFGSFVYTTSIWRLVNVFTRAAVGEYSSMIFLPILILAFWYLHENTGESRKKSFFCFVAGFTGVIETHVLTIITSLTIVLLYCLLNLKLVLEKKNIRMLFTAAIMTGLVNLGFFLPLADYYVDQPMKITGFRMMIQQRSAIIQQLFSVYSNSINGLSTYLDDINGMPLTPGLVLMSSLIFALVLLLLGYFKDIKKNMYILIMTTVISLWMSTHWFPYDWIYSHLPSVYHIIGSLQFGIRWITIATILTVTVAVICAKHLSCENKELNKLFVVIALVFSGYQAMDFISNYTILASQSRWTHFDVSSISSYRAFDHYVIQGTDNSLTKAVSEVLGSSNEIEFEVRSAKNEDYVIYVNNRSSKEEYIEIPVFAYRGVIAESDIEGLSFLPGDNNRLRVLVPAHFNGVIETRYQEPLLWRLSELISIISIVYMGCYYRKIMKKMSTV